MTGPTVDFHPDAEAEAASAIDWYADRSIVAAESFLEELDRALEQICVSPSRGERYLHQTRRYLLKRFPFIVVYRERSADIIEIVAIAHAHRRPGYWRQRVED